MPADFSPYINLKPLDIEAETVYLGAIELAQLVLPDLRLRQGTVEDAIFQAMAYTTMLNVAAINRLPDRLMSGMAALLGIGAVEGEFATLDVDINLYTGESPITIPKNSVFVMSEVFDGIRYEYPFLTTQDEIISSTSSASPDTITLTSQKVGIHPTPTAGDAVTLLTVNSAIETIVVSSPLAFYAGDNPEPDEVFLGRCAAALRSMNATLCTADQIENYILTNYKIVSKCKVYDLMNASNRILQTDIKSVSGITRASSTATVTSNSHGFSTGNLIKISGANQSEYNGIFSISNVTTNTFDYTVTGTPTTPATGTITAVRVNDDQEGNVYVMLYGQEKVVTSSEWTTIKTDISGRSIAGSVRVSWSLQPPQDQRQTTKDREQRQRGDEIKDQCFRCHGHLQIKKAGETREDISPAGGTRRQK